MRKVHITYEDGSIKTYRTIREAAVDIRCDPESVRRMALGRNRRLKAILRVCDITLEENRHQERHNRPSSNRVPVRCISETGEIVECETIQEARRLTGPTHYIAPFLDDGEYHWGWMYESMERPNKYVFDAPVGEEDMARLYRYAKHYMSRMWWLRPEDRDEIIQESVARVASDISTGKLKQDTAKFKDRAVWLYLEVKSRCFSVMDRYATYYRKKVDEPADFSGDEAWVDVVAGGAGDAEWREYAHRTMMEEMPEDLRPVATMLDEGRSRLEMRIALGIGSTALGELIRRLGSWLISRRLGEETCSDSDL